MGASAETGTGNDRYYRVGDLQVDLVARTVEREGRTLPVKGLSFELLACLVRAYPALASLREIDQFVWGDNQVGASTVTQRVKLLRDALAGSDRYDDYVETVKSRGYRLVVPVEAVASKVRPFRARPAALLAALALALAVPLAGLWLAWPFGEPGPVPSGGRETLFVLPIAAAGGDVEWAEGLRQIVIDRLRTIEALSVAPVRELPPEAGDGALVLAPELVETPKGLALQGILRDLRSGEVLYQQRVPGAGPGENADEATQSLTASVAGNVPGISPAMVAEADEPADPQAFDLYLRARYHGAQYARSDLRKGVRLLDRALEIDTGFARAYELRSLIYSLAGTPSYGWMTPGDAFDRSRQDALQALALNPRLPLANVTLGNIFLWHEWNPPAAAMAYERAIELDPGSVSAWLSIALLHTALAQYEESIQAIERALALAPMQAGVHANAGWRLLGARRFEEALDAARTARLLDPTLQDAYNIEAWALVNLGRLDEALQVPTEPLSDAARGFLLAASGRTAEAREHLQAMLNARARTYVPPTALAVVLIGLGEYEDALDWLETAIEQRSREALFLQSSAVYDPLRENPRFARLVDTVGIWSDSASRQSP